MILGYNLKYKKLGRNIELSRKDYVNSISAQVMDLAGLADLQSEKCFDLDKWKNDYKQAQHYKKNICCFPSIDFRKTYQSYFDKQNDRFKNNFISNNLKNV